MSTAQEVVHFDSVEVHAGHYISFGNQVIFCPRDTVLILADTVDYFQSRHDISTKSDEFYSGLNCTSLVPGTLNLSTIGFFVTSRLNTTQYSRYKRGSQF